MIATQHKIFSLSIIKHHSIPVIQLIYKTMYRRSYPKYTDYSDRYYQYDRLSTPREDEEEDNFLLDILETLFRWDGSEYSMGGAVDDAASKLGFLTGSHVGDLPDALQWMIGDLVSFVDESTDLESVKAFVKHYNDACKEPVSGEDEEDFYELEEEHTEQNASYHPR